MILLCSIYLLYCLVPKSFPALWPHGLEHARLLCPPLTPRTDSNSCSLSQLWCLTISYFVTLYPFAFDLSQHYGIFQWVSSLHMVPEYWSFSISPSDEHSELISFRIDWFDFLAVQETLNSFLQHHNPKASILQHSVFFMVQLSHPYMTTRKITVLSIWTYMQSNISSW